jgi:outer membrane protein insertion porin family
MFLPTRDEKGNSLYTQVDAASVVNGVCTASTTSTVTNPVNPNPPSCLTGAQQHCARQLILPSRKSSWATPGSRACRSASASTGIRRSVPSGSTFAKVLLKREGDDTKAFTFNVGTQF